MFFFFQAEDGIRDYKVTGVQTCALPISSRMWFEGWLHVLLEDADPKQWIIALGSYGYDWTIGGKKAELISFPEAMSRANNAEVESVGVAAPGYNPYFYFEEDDKEHGVWFLDAITFLNQLREVRQQKAGGFSRFRAGIAESGVWGGLKVARHAKVDKQTSQQLVIVKS